MATKLNFWSLVQEANENLYRFIEKLKKIEKKDLQEFIWRFQDLAGDIADDEYLDFIVEAEEQVTDDQLEDLCGWIVGKGETVYNRVLDNPETIPTKIDDDAPGITIQYEAERIYFERFGEHLQPE